MLHSSASTLSVPPAAPSTTSGKASRTTLSVYEKSVVKTYCEQRLHDSKTHGLSVPSQDALRHEIAVKFGWELGRSTLSKILSLEWVVLRVLNESNPDRKRKRKPRFPAFEAALVQAVREFEQQHAKHNADGNAAVLTEAVILEEAQRLKQQLGIKDEELVLSVGWLARFKQRNGIRLRKGTMGFGSGNGIGTGRSLLNPTLGRSEVAAANGNGTASTNDVEDAATAIRLAAPNAVDESLVASPGRAGEGTSSLLKALQVLPMLTKETSLCTGMWHDTLERDARIEQALVRIPAVMRVFACGGCPPTLPIPTVVDGLAVCIIGFNCVRDAFLMAAFVGEHGSVTCVETNSSAVAAADPLRNDYTTKTLRYQACNIDVVFAPSALTQRLETLLGTMDMVVLDCSFLTLPGKDVLLKLAYALLKDGGECRATALTTARRVLPDSSVHAASNNTTSQLAQVAIYREDLRRIGEDVGFVDQRCLHVVRRWPDEPDEAATGIDLALTCFRLFKLAVVEDRREDYGEQAVYLGGLDVAAAAPSHYRLDRHFAFTKDYPMVIDGNTAQVLRTSWLRRFFQVLGDRSIHRGVFCPPAVDPTSDRG